MITGLAAMGNVITLYDNGGASPVGTVTAGAGGSWSITTSILPAGINNLTATATNVAGAVSPPSTALPVTVDTSAATPTIGFSTSSGTTSANTLKPIVTGTADPAPPLP